MKRSLHLSSVASLAEWIGDGELVAFNVGPDGVVYLIVALLPLDYQREQHALTHIAKTVGTGFAKTVSQQPQTYRVVGLSGPECVLDVVIEGERFNIHDVQPLADELLLVCARSYYRSHDDFEKNGRVYTRTGKFAREFLLGDGIGSVQTTGGSVIWTSYFDEGIFGNYGWRNPVGASGLVAWGAEGRKLYEFQPSSGLDSICDCYALNVASEEDVWLYYYTEFPLVRLRRRKIESIWHMPLRGSNAFAVSAGYALFRGGYDDPDTYQLFSLGHHGKAEPMATIGLRDENGCELAAERIVGRGNALHLVSQNLLYRVDVQTVVAAEPDG